PRPRRCQPDEIVRACLHDLQEEAKARGIQLIVEASTPTAWAWADPDPLRHLADALTRNALEATPPGGTVRLTTTVTPRRLEWTIRDSGRGLDPHAARHLFDPFFCGRQAGRGLGLGLPRAARIVALAGGDLSWRSSPGRGTTFHLTLPLAEEPPDPNAR
ncbi:MAG: HAMP domain-containing histidine kinase, partial [Isosphaeraceae bacterium]|nr:HAMP domain-containing histidine kinase [Isosphaeraceae bacterium]